MAPVLAAIPWASRSLAEQISLVFHISAGSIAIISGFMAVFAAKGSQLHRRAGVVFVASMLVMGLMGAFVAVTWGRATLVNFPAGMITAYFVATALATVRDDSPFSGRPWAVSLMIVALLLGGYNLAFGLYLVANGRFSIYGVPVAPLFVFGFLGLLAATGDARILRSGALTGTRRLARHLWRMNLALFIAAGSFFLGQAKVIPKPIRIFPLLVIPPLLALVMLFYWLWRVRVRNSLRNLMLRPSPVPVAGD